MVSPQAHQVIAGFDEIIAASDEDFASSGLKVASVIRVGRLAVVQPDLLLGAIGCIESGRLGRICNRLAEWLRNG